MMPDRDTRLARALERFEAARASIDSSKSQEAYDSAVRDQWHGLADYLDALATDDLGNLSFPEAGGHLTGWMIIQLWQLVGTIVAGKEPMLVKELKGKTPRLLPLEKQKIGRAVQYIAACKAGLISDRAHTKTVAQAFGVKKNTVQAWVRDYPVDESALPSKLEEGRLKVIPVEMIEAGRDYRQRGRSFIAIDNRGRESKG